MNWISRVLFSTKTTVIALFLFAVSMAVATFVENDYGTPTTKELIYNSKWFEFIMLILILNFIGNIQRYKLYKFDKWPIFLFHISFIFLFIGGALSRYIGEEGIIHIREGKTENEIETDQTYFKTYITNKESNDQTIYKDIKFTLTSNNIPFYLKPIQRKFRARYNYEGDIIRVKQVSYTPNAIDTLEISDNGKEYLELVTTSARGRKSIFIPSGEYKKVENSFVTYNNPVKGAINITKKEGVYTLETEQEGTYMNMQTQAKTPIIIARPNNFEFAKLYEFGSTSFVVPNLAVKGTLKHLEGSIKNDDLGLVTLEVESKGEKSLVDVYGKKGTVGEPAPVTLGNKVIYISYGSGIKKLNNFSLKLDKFELERYPGSNSPSSYKSYVTLIDGDKQSKEEIYMNNVLDYKGYRFFQSSYDGDEKGTVLSVNKDFWGTTVTYIGYAMMFLGMLTSLFWSNTRFKKLQDQLVKMAKHKKVLSLLLILSSFSAFAQPHAIKDKHEVIEALNKIVAPKSEAEKFGSMLVQSIDGRIEPMNTLALEILRKVYKSDNFYGIDANQFLLAVSTHPEYQYWADMPIIKVGDKGGSELKNKTKANSEGYTSVLNLLSTDKGSFDFILEDDYRQAFNKKASAQSTYDKEVIAINERMQIMQSLIAGMYLKTIPVQNDASRTWNSYRLPNYEMDSLGNKYLGAYLSNIKNRDWNKADNSLQAIKEYQNKWAKDIVPSKTKVSAEVLYNKANAFFKLMIAYSILGGIMLILALVLLFIEENKTTRTLRRILLFCVWILLIIHFVTLIGRWYITGHAPWSNGYEAVVFISWIGVLSGIILQKNSNLFIPTAGCLVAVLLMGFAHGGDQMNPQITPLVPVLKSYWLTIHVAIITSSYGFFGLSALLGFFVLFMFVIKGKKNAERLEASIKELSVVNELSLTIGLYMLAIGTFLGGIWANESWGRYWSWDPKETWAFISIMIYVIVLHLRLVPGMRGKYIFNLLSLLAFSSVIMTYFGVNYYLSGLHSYAQGDSVPIPSWVYVVCIIIGILSIVSYLRYRKNK